MKTFVFPKVKFSELVGPVDVVLECKREERGVNWAEQVWAVTRGKLYVGEYFWKFESLFAPKIR